MRPLWWLPALGTSLAAALAFEANGLTLTSAAACLPSALCASAALRLPRLAGLLLTLGLAFVAARIARPGATAASACAGTDCSGRGASWQRIIDEREATRAGLALSGHLGVMRGAEYQAFDALIEREWSAMPGDWRGLPNPLLMRSSPERVESLRVRAKRTGKRPCILFLHGFGGLLSLYVHALAEGTHGEFDIVAPALDPLGAWWSPRGQAVIRATLEALPEDVEDVYLVGLSNGGIGATEALLDDELARRFAGVVLLSGVGDVPALSHPPPTKVLVVSGTKDPRFSDAWVGAQVATLREGSARVTWLTFPADHFLVLTHAEAWTKGFLTWR